MSIQAEALESTAETVTVSGPKPAAARQHTYGQILKSSALIGGSSLINIGLNSLRTMAMMVLLKPAGFGVLGMYQAINDLTRSVAGMGLNSSGVRQIAESVGTGDSHRIARTVRTLRHLAMLLGALGGLLLLGLCRPISHRSFLDYEHTGGVALLSLAVFFAAVAAGQMALVQGMRRIGDLAIINVLGSLSGVLLSIPIVYFWRERGVVPSLVCVAATSTLTSWWFSRKIKVEPVKMTMAQIAREASGLLNLGFIFMLVGLMPMGMAYLVRVIVLSRMGLEAAGHYNAAWTFGGLYVGFILQAMAADFYPRLTAAAQDNVECNRLVNEQAEVSLLLAGPGVIGTLAFVPIAVGLCFPKYGPAIEILRWICLGMMLRVASWPMSFILLAKGVRKAYFWTEFTTCVVQVALVWGCVRIFGLRGTGIAFFAGYLFYWFMIYAVVRSISGFEWSKPNRQIGVLYAGLIAVTFVAWYFVPAWLLALSGAPVAAFCCFYSLKTLCKLVPFDRLPRFAQRAVSLLGLVPPAARTENS
jgi:antigen flippase